MTRVEKRVADRQKDKPRVYFADGTAEVFDDACVALAYYFRLPKGTRAAFRGEGDETPLFEWSYVDRC